MISKVDGTAVEFKATFGAWALMLKPNKVAEREGWLGADIDKLSKGSAPAVAVVTVAALGPGLAHQRVGFQVDHGHAKHEGHDASTLLAKGLEVAEAVLRSKGCIGTQRVALPTASVRGRTMFLAAVVAAVNDLAVASRS